MSYVLVREKAVIDATDIKNVFPIILTYRFQAVRPHYVAPLSQKDQESDSVLPLEFPFPFLEKGS